MRVTKDGAFYRRNLPHYRSAGSIYHCRFSLKPPGRSFRFTEEWMFATVEASILMDHKKECMIHAYVVMANHAHVVVQPLPDVNEPSAWFDYSRFYSLEGIAAKIKGRSSYFIKKRIGGSGSLWQDESYDRTIRGERDLEETIDYIHHNPVRWELVVFPEQYRWSSIRTIYSGEEKYKGWLDLP